MNLLAAVSTAAGMGLDPDSIRTGLKSFSPPAGRTEVHHLESGSTVVCDYYNSNPTSLEAALALAHSLHEGKGKIWACLGDMLELGDDEERFHREISGRLTDLGVTHALLYGPRMKWLDDELKGNDQVDGRHFESKEELGKFLRSALRPDDTVVIKGSRGMAMEEVWKILSR